MLNLCKNLPLKAFVRAAPVAHTRTGTRLRCTMNQGLELWTEIG